MYPSRVKTHLRVVGAVAVEAVTVVLDVDDGLGDLCRNDDRVCDDRFTVALNAAVTRDPHGSDWHLCTKSLAREMHFDVILL